MPWTTWNCHCPSQTSFQQTDIFVANNNPDNLPACNCGQEKRRRYQICSDKDQTDGITCQKVGDELAKTGSCAGGFSNWFPFSFLPFLFDVRPWPARIEIENYEISSTSEWLWFALDATLSPTESTKSTKCWCWFHSSSKIQQQRLGEFQSKTMY